MELMLADLNVNTSASASPALAHSLSAKGLASSTLTVYVSFPMKKCCVEHITAFTFHIAFYFNILEQKPKISQLTVFYSRSNKKFESILP